MTGTELREAMTKAIEEKSLYDFIAKNYSNLSKMELVDIAKELAYTIDKEQERDVFDELDERGFFED